MMGKRMAQVRLRRGDGWRVKPQAEQVDGEAFEFREGLPITEPSIYQGETAWFAVDPNWPDNAPVWIASGDLHFLGDRP